MLSVPKILSQHPLLAEVLSSGMEYTIWKRAVEIEYPRLPDVLQRGLNAKYSVQQHINQWQVYLRACALWATGNYLGDSASSDIVKNILKANPNCSCEDVASLVEISRKFGGSNDDITGPLKTFLSVEKIPGRTVASSSLAALAKLKLAPKDLCPLVACTSSGHGSLILCTKF